MPRRVPPHGAGTTRRRRQRGAVAVEAALVTPIFMMLMFGVVEFGMLFKDWLAVTSSVRAGARLASAEPRVSTFAQDAADDIAEEGSALAKGNIKALWVYKAGTDGTPVVSSTSLTGRGNFDDCSVCWKFRWDTTTQAFVPTYQGWSATAQNACQSDPNHDSIGIYMVVQHDAVLKLVFKSIDMREHTVMALEPIPLNKVCK